MASQLPQKLIDDLSKEFALTVECYDFGTSEVKIAEDNVKKAQHDGKKKNKKTTKKTGPQQNKEVSSCQKETQN